MIPVAEPIIGDKEKAYVNDCLNSGWISSLGKYVTAFEEGFAGFCGARFGIATSNGTTALHLALVVAGIGPGDEVLLPTLTFIATANAVHYCGAKPVFLDSEPRTWNLDPARIEEKITPRTRAIIVVHLYGHPVDMDPVMTIARRHNLIVIEDAAEAHGAQYKGRPVGSIGHLAAFSFYGNKIITTGEGGMVLTDDPALAERARSLRDHGMDAHKRYWHPVIGYNYRMTNIQAAIGLGQLERIEELIALRRRNAALYNRYLCQVPGITLPPEESWAKSVYWMYSILLDERFPLGRDDFLVALKTRGVDSRPFFYPIHTNPPYCTDERFPVAESLAARGLNLPSGATLTPAQVETICSIITEISKAPDGLY